MRSIVLINGLILGSIVMAISCVSDSEGSGTSTGPTEDDSIAADEVDFDDVHAGGAAVDATSSMVIDEEPHEITEAQIDSSGRVSVEKLSCGLSILVFREYTDYWIRNCFEDATLGQVISLYEDALYVSEHQLAPSFATVSGSVRGRVLRFRRRQ